MAYNEVTTAADSYRQETSSAYTRELDSSVFWIIMAEHVFVAALFGWISCAFLAGKSFRVDLTEALLMQVTEEAGGVRYTYIYSLHAHVEPSSCHGEFGVLVVDIFSLIHQFALHAGCRTLLMSRRVYDRYI